MFRLPACLCLCPHFVSPIGLLGQWVLTYCGILVERSSGCQRYAAVFALGRGAGTWQRYAVVCGCLRFPRVHGRSPLEVCKRLWSLLGSRGCAPHGSMGLMAGYAACCTPYTRCCPMVPVQRQSTQLPATTVGESSRGGSLRRHKGGLWTVHLTSRHHVLLQGGFLSVAFKVSPNLTKHWGSSRRSWRAEGPTRACPTAAPLPLA